MNVRAYIRQIPAVLAIILLSSCISHSAPRYAHLNIGNQMIKAEIADTDELRIKGLMGRKISQSEGMLFLFDRPGRYGFWMKGTVEPLDIIWIDAGGTVVHLVKKAPVWSGNDGLSYYPDINASYVLEIKSGMADKLGISKGDKILSLPGDIID